MKQIFIDLRNEKQVNWWNNIASKLVNVIQYTYIDEVATGKHIGVIFFAKGILANYVYNKNVKFMDNPVKTKL